MAILLINACLLTLTNAHFMLQKILAIAALLAFGVMASAQTVLTGKITDRKNGAPIAFATLYVVENSKGAVSDIDGNYRLALSGKNDVNITVTCMGYQPVHAVAKAGTTRLDIKMDAQSIALKEFTVTAKYLDKTGSDATIGQEALEYIQPTSLNDIFALLPGGKMGGTNMQSSQLVSIRQVGTDESTAFGMGVTVNGIPMQNDGMRIQMSGVTGGASTADGEGNVAVNRGVDLRTMSTDHIESVTVTRGISSAAEGNLSSGTIRVNAKQGASPLRARVKFDPENKLAYVGKGFRLGDALGTLYAGADIVRSQADISDSRGAYNRVSTQLNWNNQRKWWGKQVDMNVLGAYVTSFSNNRSDEMIKAYHEKYNSRYQRATLSAKLNMTLNEPVVDNLELALSADYTSDELKHHKHVINRTVTPLQQSTTEGESEGTYLPSAYDTYYKIDNRPTNLFARLDARKYLVLGNSWNLGALLGSTINYTKNWGDGAVVDPTRPPFPSADFIRPRKNSDIPALVNQAGYVEAKVNFRHGAHEVNTSWGLREVMMLNLPTSYALERHALWEPRLQGAYTFYHHAGAGKMAHTLRAGYGVENKLPSADYLYPDKVYHDFIALNAYFNDESKRLLITNTKIQDPVNPGLRANRNVKWEAGYDLKWQGWELSLTAFGERMRGGAEYFTSYTPTTYTYYYELKHDVDSKPTRDDFYSREMRTFMEMRSPQNSARVDKRGLEYRIHIPTIEVIKSELEINGAYYHTVYSSGVPVMYRPSIMVGDGMYPYVGIYDGFDKQYASNFNTNLWVNTHLPKWKLIFTNFIQVVWFERSRMSTDVDEYPQRYMDTEGNVHPFNLENDALLGNLRRSFLSNRYRELREPVSLLWNIKATKEFGEHVKLAFFANNIVQINPKYRDNYEQTRRNWHKPFFGAELTMSF